MADSELSGNGASEPGRIPGQRSRHCGAPESDFVGAQAPTTTVTPWQEIDYVPLDESFVRAAHVHEASAQTRLLEATWRRSQVEATPRAPAPGIAWTVRPARHLRALRPSSVWLLGGLLAFAAALPVTLGLWR
jgi:hypothetical protein